MTVGPPARGNWAGGSRHAEEGVTVSTRVLFVSETKAGSTKRKGRIVTQTSTNVCLVGPERPQEARADRAAPTQPCHVPRVALPRG